MVATADTFTNAMYVVNEASSGDELEGSTSTDPSSSEYYSGGPVAFGNGSSDDVVDGNQIDGGAFLHNGSGTDDGNDDGILLNVDAHLTEGHYNDTIVNNTVSDLFDTGEESLGTVANTTIAKNTMNYTWATGIGAYYYTSWVNNTVANNTVTNSGSFTQIYSDTNSQGGPSGPEAFSYNVFGPGNSVSQTNGHASVSAGFGAALNDTDASAFDSVGNVISGNNFGTTLGAPTFYAGGNPLIAVQTSNNTCLEGPPIVNQNTDNAPEMACPTVTSFAPSAGPIAGQNGITITGSGLVNDGSASVLVGGNAATSVSGSDTSLSATVPAGSAGPASVVVSTAGVSGTILPASVTAASAYTYDPAPTVAGVSTANTQYAEGGIGGGTSVTVNGSGFVQGQTSVSFGSAAGTAVNVVSSTQLTVTSPAGSDSTGYVNITVKTPGGTSSVNANDQFAYGPTVTGLSATSGPVTGGTQVIVTGTGFNSDGGLGGVFTLSGFQPIAYTVNSDTQVTLTMPPSYHGYVNATSIGFSPDGVTGQTNEGYVLNAPQQYTYTAVTPTVTSVSTAGTEYAEGGIAGGTTVTVNGSAFAVGGTKVYFGRTLVSSGVTVVSATQLTVNSPAGSDSTGYVDITVQTPSGTSAVNANDQFAYGPTVTSFTPTSGPVAGGTQVIVTGTGFNSDGGLGGVFTLTGFQAISYTVNSDTQVTLTMPRAYRGLAGSTWIGFSPDGVTGQTNTGYVLNAPQQYTYH